MAFGKSRRFGDNVNLLYFKIESKDLDKPRFKVTKRTAEGQYEVVDPAAERVSGTIIDVEPKATPYEGKTIESTDVFIQDGNEVYSVGIGFTNLGRNILNSLLALKSYGNVDISLYQSKPKPGQPKTFASAATRQGGVLVRGKFERAELPAVPKVKVGANEFSDDSQLNAFFKAEVLKLKVAIKAANEAGGGAQSVAAPVTVGASDTAPEAGDGTEPPF